MKLSHFSKFRVGYFWHTKQFSTEFQLHFLKPTQEIDKNKGGSELLISITSRTNVQGQPLGFDTKYLAPADRKMQIRLSLKVVWES